VEGLQHPIRLTVATELQRSRLTVFFRLPLAIVHIIWLIGWSLVAYITAIIGWFAALITGQLPDALHRFLAAYVRFATQVSAFVFLACDEFPGFAGREGSYPIDVHIDPPRPQNRWKTGFRLILAIPALILGNALTGGTFNGGGSQANYSLGLLAAVAILAWFLSLARASITPGLRDAMSLGLAFNAQQLGYVLLLTDRYPQTDPEQLALAEPPPPRWARLTAAEDDGQRNRLTVFFRLVLALPAIIWLYLWGLFMILVAIANWFALLITGDSPEPLHRITKAFVRYGVHVGAYLCLLTEPYPWFSSTPDEPYPVDVEFAERAPQNRWKTGFRLILAIPAWLVGSAYGNVLFAVAVLGWFASLFTARMPTGLRKLGLASLNYTTQVNAYSLLLTDEYPHTGPEVPRQRSV
jgi:hypothetical protein